MTLDVRTASDSRFEAETQLAGPVEAWLATIGSSCIGREVEVGFGIPDLVAGVGSERSLKNRRRQAPPVTAQVQIALLEYCTRSRTETELRAWAPNGFPDLKRRALLPLLRRGLLTIRNGKLRSRVQPKDPFERIIAVELKLSNASRGLAQAYAYRAFADASYLAMPAHRVDVGLMDRARAIGLGVLAVHRTFVEEVVEPDPDSKATTGRRRMASEHTMAAQAESNLRVAGAPRNR